MNPGTIREIRPSQLDKYASVVVRGVVVASRSRAVDSAAEDDFDSTVASTAELQGREREEEGKGQGQ
jgi:hypothetical protein